MSSFLKYISRSSINARKPGPFRPTPLKKINRLESTLMACNSVSTSSSDTSKLKLVARFRVINPVHIRSCYQGCAVTGNIKQEQESTNTHTGSNKVSNTFPVITGLIGLSVRSIRFGLHIVPLTAESVNESIMWAEILAGFAAKKSSKSMTFLMFKALYYSAERRYLTGWHR